MAKIQKNLKLEEQDIINLKVKQGSIPFQTYVEALIKKDLYGELEGDMTTQEEVRKLETNKSMEVLYEEALHEQMKIQMADDPSGMFAGMSSKDIAALYQKHVGKTQVDPELEKEAIGLKECINKLPSLGDITKELSTAKNRMKKAQYELEMEKCIIKVLRNKLIKSGEWESMKEFLDEAAKMLNDWARDCRARDIDYEAIKLIAIAKGVYK